MIGHSWGAYLALLTALEHPESTRALVYISGNGSPDSWRDHGAATYRAERIRRMSTDELRRLDDLDKKERSWNEEIEFRRLSWMTDFVDLTTPQPELVEMAATPLQINWALNRALSPSRAVPHRTAPRGMRQQRGPEPVHPRRAGPAARRRSEAPQRTHPQRTIRQGRRRRPPSMGRAAGGDPEHHPELHPRQPFELTRRAHRLTGEPAPERRVPDCRAQVRHRAVLPGHCRGGLRLRRTDWTSRRRHHRHARPARLVPRGVERRSRT